MPSTIDQAAQLEAQAAQIRAAQAAEDAAAEAARLAAEIAEWQAIHEENDSARQARDDALEAANTAAAQGKPLADLYKLFCAAQAADARCGSYASAAPKLDQLDPIPNHVVGGYAPDFRTRRPRCQSLYSGLSFAEWLAGVDRQRRDTVRDETSRDLSARVATVADKAEAAARKTAKAGG